MRLFSGRVFAAALLILLIIIAVFPVALEPVKGEHTSSATDSPEPCNGIMVAPAPNADNVPLNTTIVFSWTTSNSPGYVNLQLTPQVRIANVTKLVLTVPAGTENSSNAEMCNQSFRYIFSLSQLLKPATAYNATLLYGAQAQSLQSATWTFMTVSSKQAPPPFPVTVVFAVAIVIAAAAIIVALVVRRNHLRRAHTSNS